MYAMASDRECDYGRFVEILPGVFRCTLTWNMVPGVYAVPVCTFLVQDGENPNQSLENRWLLIDAGHDEHVPELVAAINIFFKRMETLSTKPAKLTHILVTHGHLDHVAAIPQLLSLFPDCRVVIHEREIPFVSEGLSYTTLKGDNWVFAISKILIKHNSVTSVRVPRDRIDLAYDGSGIGSVSRMANESTITAFETPGHTPGSMSYRHNASGAFFVGDAFMHLPKSVFAPTVQKTLLVGQDSKHDSREVKKERDAPNLPTFPPCKGCQCSGPAKASTSQYELAIQSMRKISQQSFTRVFPSHDTYQGLSKEEIERYLVK